MARYRLIGDTPLQYRRKRHVDGGIVLMDEAHAAPLVARGRLKPEDTTTDGAAKPSQQAPWKPRAGKKGSSGRARGQA